MIDLEKNKKTIMELILFTIIIIFAFINISYLWTFLTYIITILMPFIIGAMIAFVLNVLLNVVENKLFKKIKRKNWNKLKRPISLITTFIIIIAILVLVLGLVIPQLKNTVELFTENFDSYRKQSITVLENIGINKNSINQFSKELSNIEKEVTNYFNNNKQEIMKTTVGIATSVIGTLIYHIRNCFCYLYFLYLIKYK